MELAGVRIEDPQTVLSGETLIVTLVPEDGYTVESAVGCDGVLTELEYQTGAITEDCTIEVSFREDASFVVVAVASPGGSIAPNETQEVGAAQTVEFEVLADPGTDNVLVAINGCGGTLNGTTFTTAPIQSHCHVVAEFGKRSVLPDTGITGCGNYDEVTASQPTGAFDPSFASDLDCAQLPTPATAEQAGIDSIGFDVPGGQDAHFGRDARFTASSLPKVGDGAAGFDFTRLNDDGSEYTGSGDYSTDPWMCVRDNHTGLVWEVKEPFNGVEGETPRDGDDRFVWYNSIAAENGGFAGSVQRPSTKCFGQLPATTETI
ncbi:MAG: hypothetical protein AAFY60_20305, partial [Myxococcota bacterium]